MRSNVVHSPGILQPLVWLAGPVLIEQVLGMLVGLSDTLLAGHYLSQSHLAAMTLLAYLLWAFNGLFSVIAIGSTAMVARFIGAGDYEDANRAAHQSLLVGTVLALVATAAMLALGPRLVGLLGLTGEPADLANRYLQFLLPMVPFMMLEAVIIACLHGAGDTITGLVAMVLINVVNIALSWSLILGLGPLPQLGWDGVAIGTSAGFAIGGLVPLAVLARGRAGLRLDWRLLRPEPALIRRLLRIGLPGGADVMSLIGLQLIFLALINQLGTLAVAAHGVARRMESLAYLPGYAFQVAAGTLVGQFLVRRRSAAGAAERAAGGGVQSDVHDRGDDRAVLGCRLAGPMVRRGRRSGGGRAGCPAAADRGVGAGAAGPAASADRGWRGAGDMRWPLAFTLIGFVGVRLPLAWWLAIEQDWGVRGAWIAMAVDLGVRVPAGARALRARGLEAGARS